MMDKMTSILIVGNGLAGLWTAYFALEAGMSVQLIGHSDPLNHASTYNAGSISQTYGPALVDLAIPNLWTVIHQLRHPDKQLKIHFPTTQNEMKWYTTMAKTLLHRQFRRIGIAERQSLHTETIKQITALSDTLHVPIYHSGRWVLYDDEATLRRDSHHLEKKGAIKAFDITQHFASDTPLPQRAKGGLYYPHDIMLESDGLKKALIHAISTHPNAQIHTAEIRSYKATHTHITSLIDTTGREYHSNTYVFAVGAAPTSFMNPGILSAAGYCLDVTVPHPFKNHQLYTWNNQLIYSATFPDKIRLTSYFFLGQHAKDPNRILPKFTERFHRLYPEIPKNTIQNIECFGGNRPISQNGRSLIGPHPHFSNAYLLNGAESYGHSYLAGAKRLIEKIDQNTK